MWKRGEGDEGEVHAYIWNKKMQFKENRYCQSPEVGSYLACLRNNKKDQCGEVGA